MPLDTAAGRVWAAPDTTARIGPNAVLQLIAVLEEEGGPELVAHVMALAGLFDIPSDDAMIDERPVARLHQALRRDRPGDAPRLAWAAGEATGNYIIANRIPRPVQWLLRALPVGPAAKLLSVAIAKHAWTFAGSGRFSVVSTRPMVFEIADNPVVRGEQAQSPICFWHVAVFETLFRRLVAPDFRARETACCAVGAPACRFELRRIG